MHAEGVSAQRLPVLVGLVGAASLVVLASIARRPGTLPLLAGAALVGLDIVLIRWALPGTTRRSTVSPRIVSLLAACWVVVALMPMHDFTSQSSRAAVSALSLQTMGELALFAIAGAFAAFLLRSYVPLASIGLPLTCLPVWVLASASWADAPAYALARGAEYLAMAVLAMATAGLALRDRRAMDSAVDHVMRWTVLLTVVLVGLGHVLGPLFVTVTPSNVGRFTWPGAHPTQSGFLLGVALLILLSTNSERLRVAPWMRGAGLVVCAHALYANQTRTVLGGIALGGALLLVLHARRRPDAAALTGFFIVGGSIVAVLAAGGALGGYILRGDDFSKLTTLNGRTDLWAVGLEALSGPMDWIHGLGYGATRVVFVDEFAFAGNAHNSVLGNLVSLGVVGVALVVTALVAVTVVAWRCGILSGTDYGPTVLALLLYTVVAAITTDNLAEPHFGLAVLFLTSAVVFGWARAVDPETTSETGTAATLDGGVLEPQALQPRHRSSDHA